MKKPLNTQPAAPRVQQHPFKKLPLWGERKEEKAHNVLPTCTQKELVSPSRDVKLPPSPGCCIAHCSSTRHGTCGAVSSNGSDADLHVLCAKVTAIHTCVKLDLLPWPMVKENGDPSDAHFPSLSLERCR